MNNLAFQIYGLKKTGIFQSVWKTDAVSEVSSAEFANITAQIPLPTGWLLNGTSLVNGGYNHTAGNTSTLAFSTSSLNANAGWSYQLKYTITGPGSVVINFGNVSSAPLIAGTNVIITLTPTGSGALSITPSNDFAGNISLSVKGSASAANQIQLPLTSIPIGKSIWIDWGDNSYTNINSSNIIQNRLHTYITPGEYTVRILGDNFNFGFGSTVINDRFKIKSISSWGKLKMGASSFYRCSNVTMSGITDIPDLTGVTSLSSAFQGCSLLTTVGRINEWNTSSVISMSNMFAFCPLFNSNIGNWNTSAVTSMGNMFGSFGGVSSFNQDISGWDVSNVTNMIQMFDYATSFNQNLSNWERSGSSLSKVTNMSYMFRGASNFNNGSASGVANQLPWTINTTATSVVMNNMFQGTSKFNSNLGTGTTPWNVSKVTTFQSMFQGASNFRNGDDSAPINNWNIGGGITGTITLESMFYSASAFNRDISGWDVSKVNTLSGIFAYAINFNNGLNTNINPVTLRAGLDGWNIVVTNNMYGVFFGASNFNRPLSNWNTTNVTWMLRMFNQATSFNQDISKWNVGKVTNHSDMFRSATAFNNGSNSDTNPVTGLTGINGWNINTTAASVDMSYMFSSASAFNREVSSWNVSKVTLMNNMFNVATSFNNGLAVGLPGTLAWNTIGVTTMRQMFDGATAFNCNIGGFNVSSCIDFGYMFRGATRFNNGGSASIADWTLKTTGGIAMDAMFNNAIVFNQPIGVWNVSRVYTMFRMFSYSQFNQPIENWDVSNVNDMAGMFEGDILFNQDISKWNVGKVTTFGSMFNGATAFNNGLNTNTNPVTGLTGINGWNINTTAASVDMSSMFRSASAFNREVGSWNVSKVTLMNAMFNAATAFNNGLAVGLPGTLAWNTIGVTTMRQMFDGATAFNCNIGGFNVSSCIDFGYMFRGATRFNNGGSASIADWTLKTTGGIAMDAMFNNAIVFNQNIGNWDVRKVTNFQQMFQGSGFNNGGSPDINNWAINTTLGTNVNMSSMFSTTGSFNQPIGNWNVSNVTNFSNFMFGKTNLNFSSTNLDAIYNGWIVNGVKPNLSISFGSAKYTSAGATGRAILTNPVGYNWTIIDGGQI